MKTTKGDKVLIVTLLVLSLLLSLFIWNKNKNVERKYISIQVNGEEIDRIRFSKDMIGETYEIKTKYGRNVIEIGDEEVKVIDADCPDKLDIKQGTIDKPGQMLVCLPNRLIVEIKEDTKLIDFETIDSFNY